jgi:hypothetical protein
MTSPDSIDGNASFVVFHDEHGEVFHVHKHVSFSGRHAPDEDVEAGARALLDKIGRSRDGMRALLIKDLQMEPGKKYRVDVARQVLVAIADVPAR